MRLIVLVAALAFANACTVSGATEGATGGVVEIREIGSGAFGAAESVQAVAAFDDAGYRAQWRALVNPDQQPPAVDFASESAVFILGGQRATGGYSVVVNGATLEGETLVVDAVVEGPPAGAIVSQVITSPYAVIAVKSRAFKSVQWRAAK